MNGNCHAREEGEEGQPTQQSKQHGGRMVFVFSLPVCLQVVDEKEMSSQPSGLMVDLLKIIGVKLVRCKAVEPGNRYGKTPRQGQR